MTDFLEVFIIVKNMIVDSSTNHNIINRSNMVSNDRNASSRNNTAHGEHFISNIKNIITTLEKNQISVPNEACDTLLSAINDGSEYEVIHIARESNCYNFNKLQESNYKFVDLRNGDEYVSDIKKLDTLLKIINAGQHKEVDFAIEEIRFDSLSAIPLSTAEYKTGLPFLLSCETGHCDILGGKGGNYPLAEYLSKDGTSCKIFNDEAYLGHFNVWKTLDNDFIIGTIAINKNQNYNTAKLRCLFDKFACSLMSKNPECNKILLGIGGQNLGTLYPSIFLDKTSAFNALGKIRHEDMSDGAIPDNIKENIQVIKDSVKLDFHGGVSLNSEDIIGMTPDERADFKNSMILMKKDLLEETLNTINDKEETFKNQNKEELKLLRAEKWAENNNYSKNIDAFNTIKEKLENAGFIDIKMENTQHQDLTFSFLKNEKKFTEALAEMKYKSVPYTHTRQTENNSREYVKLRLRHQ